MIPSSGDIKGMTVPRLFQDFRAEKKSGALVLTRDKESKRFFFRTGELLYATSNVDADQLGASLVNSGKLSTDQRAAAAEAARSSGKPFGAMLVERGFLSPKDLIEGAKQQVSQIVMSVLPWLDGKFTVENQSLPLGEIVPLQLSTAALLQSCLGKQDWKIIRKSLPSLKTVPLQTKDAASYQQGLVLDQEQQTILALVNGARTIEEICSLSEMGDFTTLKALYALYALRLVDTIDAQAAKAQAQTAAAEARTAQEAARADDQVTKEMILHALNSLDRQDYYEMLGLGRSATPQEVKKAYFRFAKLYHPDRHMDSELADMKGSLETLFMNITEAYNILNKEETRDRYNLALASGIKRYRTADQAPAARQETQKATAASQFNEGLKQFRVQNYWGAEEAFSWASRLDPANSDYVFHRGLALARVPRRGHDAEELLKQALKMSPKTEYFLELGNFYAKNGLKAKALVIFTEALQRDPNSEKVKQAIQSVGGPQQAPSPK